MHEVTGKEMYDRIEERALLMKYKDITELCKASGASRGALSDLKYGRSESLSMKTMTKLANALNVSIEFFTAPEPDDERKEKAAIDVIDDDLREYLDELRNRPEKRLLFSVTKNATKSQIEAIVKMIEEMQGDQ